MEKQWGEVLVGRKKDPIRALGTVTVGSVRFENLEDLFPMGIICGLNTNPRLASVRSALIR